MQDSQKIIQFLESLLEDVIILRDILKGKGADSINVRSKLDSLQGKIEGAKMALGWTQKEKNEK